MYYMKDKMLSVLTVLWSRGAFSFAGFRVLVETFWDMQVWGFLFLAFSLLFQIGRYVLHEILFRHILASLFLTCGCILEADLNLQAMQYASPKAIWNLLFGARTPSFGDNGYTCHSCLCCLWLILCLSNFLLHFPWFNHFLSFWYLRPKMHLIAEFDMSISDETVCWGQCQVNWK